ncbi:MAG TPA: winged helix-turn-helix domain-containing protein [Pseudonocardiaceae bacterium]
MTERAEAAVALVGSALRRAEEGRIAEALQLADEGARHCLDEADRLGGAGEVESGLLAMVGVALRLEYAYGGDLRNLEDAIDALRAGIARSAGQPAHGALLAELGNALLTWSRRRFDRAALDEAIDVLRQARALGTLQALATLASALSTRCEWTAERADFDEAVAAFRKAVEATPDDLPQGAALANFGALLLNWALLRDDLTTLDEAIGVLRRAGDQSQVLGNLSAALLRRHEQTSSPDDLNEAVVLARRAVEATRPDSPEYPELTRRLATTLQALYSVTGDQALSAEVRALLLPIATDVLLAVPDDELADALEQVLLRSGLTVRREKSPARLLTQLGSTRVVVLYDRFLSGEEQAEFWQRRAAQPGVAVIMAGSNLVEDRIAGQRSGADDYLSIPFGAEELVARVHAVSRRGAPPTPSTDGPSTRLGDLEIDPNRHEVRVRGELIPLSGKEFNILALLARRPDGVVSRWQLMTEVWGVAEPRTDRSIDVLVASLRMKLGMPHLIRTVRGVGYRIVPPVDQD